MPFLRALLVVLLIATGSCTGTDAIAPLPVDGLQGAPLSVVVGGQAVVLVPYLWRDFQPISPPDGTPLVALLRVAAADGTALSASFHVDAAWIANGADVWTTSVGEERLATPSPVYYEVVARGGPRWGPGVGVDVVVRIRELSGSTQLLRAAGQVIRRTE